MNTETIVTDSLGFELEVTITIGNFFEMGQHRTFENYETKRVDAGAPHKINIQEGMDAIESCMAAAHEAYHLFESIRHLITANEETQAETFGHLVQRIFALTQMRAS